MVKVKRVKERSSLSEWAFLIPGTLFVVISQLLLLTKATSHPSAMKLFFYIGLLFMVIGGFKLFRKSRLGADEERFALKLAQPKTQQKNKVTTQPHIISCSRCLAKNYSSSNFCHMCGKKL
ncbi:MAG: hypothetical protein ACOCQQ_00865 [Candidatus Nanoarchaeia archaeon]